MSINFETTQEERFQLALLAIEAKQKAYCPYSNFRVGASLLLDDGTYHTGSNVEVASTPVGICAERCAIAPVVASYCRPAMPRIRALAVSTDIWPPASPCGMCRQFIREFSEPELKIYMCGVRPESAARFKRDDGSEDVEKEARAALDPDGDGMLVMTIGELLPNSFGPNDMDKR